MMLTIRFQDQEWLFLGDSLDESAAITAEADYRTGNESFAHYFPWDGGVIKRHGQVIGHRADIAIIGPMPIEMTTEEYLDAIESLLGGW